MTTEGVYANDLAATGALLSDIHAQLTKGRAVMSLEGLFMLWRTHFACRNVASNISSDELSQRFGQTMSGAIIWLEEDHAETGQTHVISREDHFQVAEWSTADREAQGSRDDARNSWQVDAACQCLIFGLERIVDGQEQYVIGTNIGNDGLFVSCHPSNRASLIRQCRQSGIRFKISWYDSEYDEAPDEGDPDGIDRTFGDPNASLLDNPKDFSLYIEEYHILKEATVELNRHRPKSPWEGRMDRLSGCSRGEDEVDEQWWLVSSCVAYEFSLAAKGSHIFELYYHHDLADLTTRAWQKEMDEFEEDWDNVVHNGCADSPMRQGWASKELAHWVHLRAPILAYQLYKMTGNKTLTSYRNFGKVEARKASLRIMLPVLLHDRELELEDEQMKEIAAEVIQDLFERLSGLDIM
jgi:hypothetical protein